VEDRPLVEREYATFTERIAALIPHYFTRVWNDGRVEFTDFMWHDDIVLHSPVKPEPVRGRQALLAYVHEIQAAFSDLHFAIDDVVADGDRVVLRVTQTGTQTGDYFGIPPTGRRVHMSEIFVFRSVEGGPLGACVAEIWLVLNALELMQQLKLFPAGDPPRWALRAIVAVQKAARVDNERNLPPGPSGIAYVPAFARDTGPFLARTRERYGDVVRFRAGPLKGYVISHPREIAHVLDENIRNYPHGAWLRSKVAATIGDSVFGVDGETWWRYRRTVEPLVSADASRRIAEIAADEATRTAHRWRALGDRALVDMRDEMEKLDVAVAGRTIFGDDWAPNSALISATRSTFVAEAGRALASPLGLIPHRVPTPFIRRFLRVREAYDRFVAEAIDRRRRDGGGDDVLSGLVAARDPETGEALPDRAIRGNATAMLFLWQPTAMMLTWLWYRLDSSPSAAERLRAELEAVLAGRTPEPADLDRLSWMRMVIDEAIRLDQPGVLQPREALEDDELAGYAVPAGTRVVIGAYATNRHPEFWDRPDEFVPERFEDPNVVARPPYALFRFGEPAPRRCLGYHFALTELPVVLATLAPEFRPSTVSANAPATRFTVAVDLPDGLPMRLERV
jgi:cytochrome P450/predicted ester cyclase